MARAFERLAPLFRMVWGLARQGVKISLFLALCTACGARWHTARVNYHALKLEALGARWEVGQRPETKVVTLAGKTADFTFTMPTYTTTKFITKDSIRFQIVRVQPDIDTAGIVAMFRAEIECPPDSVEVVTTTSEFKLQPPPKPFPWTWLFIAITAVALMVMAVRLAR